MTINIAQNCKEDLEKAVTALRGNSGDEYAKAIDWLEEACFEAIEFEDLITPKDMAVEDIMNILVSLRTLEALNIAMRLGITQLNINNENLYTVSYSIFENIITQIDYDKSPQDALTVVMDMYFMMNLAKIRTGDDSFSVGAFELIEGIMEEVEDSYSLTFREYMIHDEQFLGHIYYPEHLRLINKLYMTNLSTTQLRISELDTYLALLP